MPVIVLTSTPGRGAVDPTLAEALRSGWGGAPLRWLAPGEAVEFEVPAVPDTFEATRQELDARGVDVNAVPNEGRRKRLLLADMDSTMIQQECIDELAAEAGVGERVAAITARAMNGEMGFEGALRERVGLLAGLEVAVIDKVLGGPDHADAGRQDAGGDDEGQRGLGGFGVGRVHGLHPSRRGAVGL